MYRHLLFLLAAVLLGSCQQQAETKHARNVILFVGDGMGVATVTAARIFDGQSRGLDGEEHVLPFETFPNVALAKTYNTDQQVPDSSGTITAMLTGTKTRAGVINVGPEVLRRSCERSLASPLTPVSETASAHGKSIGIVTTTRITHATPAGIYARTPERDWEDDSHIPQADRDLGCRDIAWQFVNAAGSPPDVALGGGRRHFFGFNRGGLRVNDEDDLVSDWLDAGDDRQYVTTAEELDDVQPGKQVLGLFAHSHMHYEAEKDAHPTEPSLTQMATTAIRLLDNNKEGYFLLIEGGRIDHAHHDSKPGWALIETQEFANAVAAVLNMIDLEETLVIVTADHSHVFMMGGYATRGNPILGLVHKNDEQGQPLATPDIAQDGEPYTTLSYANGPGAIVATRRPMPQTGVDMVVQSLVPVVVRDIDGKEDHDETHGGEDVAVYAIGPGSDAVHGVMEQNRIHDVITGAFGWTD